MSWPTVNLSDLCEINVGKTPARNNDSYWGTGYPWLSIADMAQGRDILVTKEEITEKAVKETNIKVVPKGTVLFSFKLSIGKIGVATRDLYTNEAIAALPIKDRRILCEDYLVHALSCWENGISINRAVMGLVLNKAILSEIKIPLPSLNEQKRIAAILNKADSISYKRQQAIKLADNFLRSVFLDKFGDPITNPKKWKIRSLNELGHVITGSTPPSSKEDMFGNEVPFVTPGDLNSNISRVNRWLTKEGATHSRVCRSGSLMACCIGATIGKVGIANMESAFNQQINVIEWGEDINDLYGYFVFKLYPKLITENAIKTTLPILKKSLFEQIQIPIPSKEKQKEFAVIVTACWKLLEKQKISLGLPIFDSLSQKAFAGEL